MINPFCVYVYMCIWLRVDKPRFGHVWQKLIVISHTCWAVADTWPKIRPLLTLNAQIVEQMRINGILFEYNIRFDDDRTQVNKDDIIFACFYCLFICYNLWLSSNLFDKRYEYVKRPVWMVGNGQNARLTERHTHTH